MQKRRKTQWKFGRLQNFATLLPCTSVVDCFLTRFLWFCTNLPLCNFGPFKHFCNFLCTEHLYKLSQACNINQLSVHQSLNKIGRQVSSPPVVV